MKRTVLRTVAALAIAVGSTASTHGVVDAAGSKRPKAPTSTCEQDCPQPTLSGGRGIRW